MGILPSHARWSDFLLRLRYVVVDELHTLRGVFGSHVAHVLRRLRRRRRALRRRAVVLLRERDDRQPGRARVRAVRPPGHTRSTTTAPRVRARSFAIWQRPLLDEHSGARASANVETARVLARFVADGHPTLAFTRSRRGAELVAAYARDMLATLSPAAADRVASYRAGYLPRERRELERALSDGTLLGIAATNALELGIDVGALDTVVLNGFPGTLASLWQQVGRAGRGTRQAAAVLVAGDDQLDQWYAAHPDELFTRRPEAAVVNPQNPFVLDRQVACAAHELPLQLDDERWFGPGLDDAVLPPRRSTTSSRRATAGCTGPVATRPAPEVGLRTGSSVEYRLVGARRHAHRHRRRRTRLPGRAPGRDLPAPGSAVARRTARPRRATRRCSWRPTTPTSTPRRAPRSTSRSSPRTGPSPLGGGTGHLGSVEVTHRVVAYQRKRIVEQRGPRGRAARPAPAHAVDPRLLVHRPRADARGRRGLPGAAARHGARRRARADRPAPAVRDLRPVGRRRGLDGRPPGHRPSRRSSSTTASPAAPGIAELAFSRGPPPRRRHPGPRRGVPVRRRLPVVRAVAEVRELERAPRQGRRRAAAPDPVASRPSS